VYLENVVFDATDPQALGRFWETTLGTETLTDEVEGFETRLTVADGPVLDLCFQRVPDPPTDRQRLQLHVRGDRSGPGEDRTDPAGNRYAVRPGSDTGPLAAVRLEVADPARDQEFWRWLTGWVPVAGTDVPTLQHPSRRGPLLELAPEAGPKGPEKNRIHLDVRLETGDDVDTVTRAIADHGGSEVHFDWGDLPWRHFTDPSGNELCVLPART
jgi:hypothetical protein